MYLVDNSLKWISGCSETNSDLFADSNCFLKEKLFKPWMDFYLGPEEGKHEEDHKRCQGNANKKKDNSFQ